MVRTKEKAETPIGVGAAGCGTHVTHTVLCSGPNKFQELRREGACGVSNDVQYGAAAEFSEILLLPATSSQNP